MKRIILSLIAILALHSGLKADNITREEKFVSLSGISVSDNFNVKIVDGSTAKVTLTLEDVLADFVHLSLVDGVLSISYDEKSLTKEVKAVIKGRDPKSLMMDVVISVPSSSDFHSISLCENAVLVSKASFGASSSFTVNVDDNAVIKSMNLNASEAVITTKKHANVKATLSCGKSNIKCEGSSIVELNASGNESIIESEGSATVRFTSSVGALSVVANGSSKLSFTGTANSLDVNGKNYSNIDASALETKSANITLSGSSCDVNAVEKLSINICSLAKLYYAGAPEIEINKIDKASVLKKESADASSSSKK